MARHLSSLTLPRTLVVLFLAACASISKLTTTLDPPDWRNQPQHRSAAEVEKIGQALAEEAIRVVIGAPSDALTRSKVWRVRYDSDSGPPAVSPFAKRLLREAYARVPREVLRNIVWQDRYPSLASGDYGVLINKARATDLVWFVDSATLTLAASDRRILVREPGDFALLMLISHEMAHLALDVASLPPYPESVIECAADVIAGFQTAVVGTRMSTEGLFELGVNGAVDALSRATLPGEWISRDLHPDNEQRGACLHRGIGMYDEQRTREPIAGSILLRSERDSLIDSLSLGKMTFARAAIAEATTILSIPQAVKSAPTQRSRDFGDLQAATLLALTDSLLKRFASGSLSSVVGGRLAVGVSLFPGIEFNELLLKTERPWKCVVVAGSADIGRSVGCYVLTEDTDALVTRFYVENGLQSDSVRMGFRVLSAGPATPTSASLHLRQWLFVSNNLQAMVSIYDEPYTTNPYSGERSGLNVLWFSFSDLSLVPRGKRPNR